MNVGSKPCFFPDAVMVWHSSFLARHICWGTGGGGKALPCFGVFFWCVSAGCVVGMGSCLVEYNKRAFLVLRLSVAIVYRVRARRAACVQGAWQPVYHPISFNVLLLTTCGQWLKICYNGTRCISLECHILRLSNEIDHTARRSFDPICAGRMQGTACLSQSSLPLEIRHQRVDTLPMFIKYSGNDWV